MFAFIAYTFHFNEEAWGFINTIGMDKVKVNRLIDW